MRKIITRATISVEELGIAAAVAKAVHAAIVGWGAAYVGLISLAASIYAAVKARTAAAAASQARDELRKFDVVIALSDIVRRMDDLKSFHRGGVVSGLPERYSAARLLLVEVKQRIPNLTAQQRDEIQLAVQFLHDIEVLVDKRKAVPDAKTTGILNTHTDKLVALLNQFRLRG